MIKDKITPQLKKAFSESIDKTKNTHREHGFYMCIADRLFPSEIKREGSMCRIETDMKTGICPDKIQGFFHAHPHKPLLEMMIGRKISDIEIKKIRIKSKEFEKLGITIQTPSHRDVLTAFITKCEKRTEGTTCTGSDLETNKVECWTPKKNADNFITCNIAKIDDKITKEIGGVPKRWIRRLFDKEIINLE